MPFFFNIENQFSISLLSATLNLMNHNTFIFASSPEDLAARFDDMKKQHGLRKQDRVVLVIDDARIVLCPFEFKASGWLRWSALSARMVAEAAEMLSLEDPKDVSVDFQIFDRVQDRVCGAFLCCPRSVLESYIVVVNKAGLLIDGFTIPSLVNIDRAFAGIKSLTQRSAYLNFTAERIDRAIFLDDKCELLRVIPFDNNDEAVGEVVRSLKSVCAKSQNKECSGLFVSGDIEKGRPLVNAAAQAMGVEVSMVKQGEGVENEQAARYFRLNLVRQYVFTRKMRRKIYWAMDIAIAILVAVMLHGVHANFVHRSNIKKTRNSFDQAQLEQARQLEKKLSEKK
jgi:hypothetical protein